MAAFSNELGGVLVSIGPVNCYSTVFFLIVLYLFLVIVIRDAEA